MLRIRITEEPQLKNNILRFKAEVIGAYLKTGSRMKSAEVRGKLMLMLKQVDFPGWIFKYGDELLIRPLIKEIDSPANPGEFDYRHWLHIQNVCHQSFLGKKTVLPLRCNSGNPLWSYAIGLRSDQVAFYQKMLPDKEDFAIASTLILGYKSDLSQETIDIYSRTGTIHALSVSGMHVGIVYVVLNWLLSFMDRKRVFAIVKVMLLLSAVWCYALLTGFSPSVLRSAIMISVFITAKSSSRKANAYNILAFAAFCLLVYDPFLLWNIGFQLSFLAVLGLIALQPKIELFLPVKNKYVAKLWGLVAVSLSAQLATLPLSIYYFHQFPVYFLLSNLFITIPAALLMYIGIALLIFRIAVLAPLLAGLINFTNRGLLFIAELPGSGISGIWINRLEMIVLSASIAAFILLFHIPHSKFLKWSMLLFLSFQCLYCFRQLEQLTQQKVLSFTVRKNKIAAVLQGNNAVLFCLKKPIMNDFNRFIKPGLEQSGIRRIYWKIILPQD